MPWVEEHVRGGRKVRRYFRWAPGARRDLAILALLGLAAAGYSSSGTGTGAQDSGSGTRPRPASTAMYPVHFPGWENPKPAPRPTVSYPIPFDRR